MKIRWTKREKELTRWTENKAVEITASVQYKAWKKNNGLFYAKGGKGIEKVNGSKRKTVNTFAVQGKIRGKHTAPYSGIRRERSKAEINALMEQVR